jgi:hypothetical protein
MKENASLGTTGWLLDRNGSLKDVSSDPCPQVDTGHEDSIERAVLLLIWRADCKHCKHPLGRP